MLRDKDVPEHLDLKKVNQTLRRHYHATANNPFTESSQQPTYLQLNSGLFPPLPINMHQLPSHLPWLLFPGTDRHPPLKIKLVYFTPVLSVWEECEKLVIKKYFTLSSAQLIQISGLSGLIPI